MVTWNNLDTLTSYAKLKDLKDHVDIKEAMAVKTVRNVSLNILHLWLLV